MIIGILLLEAFVLAWAGRLSRKLHAQNVFSPKELYWKIVKGMAWRILILAVFPLPEIAAAIGLLSSSFTGEQAAQMTAAAIMIPLVLYPLFFLSVMWRARSLVNPRSEYLPASKDPEKVAKAMEWLERNR